MLGGFFKKLFSKRELTARSFSDLETSTKEPNDLVSSRVYNECEMIKLESDTSRLCSLQREKEKLEKKARQIDENIIAIQKSTRTNIFYLSKAHDYLRMKYQWYYNWHLLEYSSTIHLLVLIIYLIAIAGIFVISSSGGWNLAKIFKPDQPSYAISTTLVAKDTSKVLKATDGETEVLEKRVKNFKTFKKTEDGKEIFRVAGDMGPIHYRSDPFNESEQFKEIDLTIKDHAKESNDDWDYEVTDNGYQVRLWNSRKIQNDDVRYIAQFRRAGKFLEMAPSELVWENASGDREVISKPVDGGTPEIDNDNYTITWKNVFGQGIDFRYNISPDKFFKTVIVNSKDNLPATTIDPNGLKLTIVMAIKWDDTVKASNDFAKNSTLSDIDLETETEAITKNKNENGNKKLKADLEDPDEQKDNPKEFSFKNDQSQNLWWMDQPKAWDSGERKKTFDLGNTFSRVGDKVYNELSLAGDDLNSSGTQFPLFIDTTMTEEQIAATGDDGLYCVDVFDGPLWVTTADAMSVGNTICDYWETIGTAPYDSVLRFTTIPIPQGATIDSASISLKAFTSLSGATTNLKIRAQDEDSAAQITSTTIHDNRSWTTAETSWSSVASWTAASWYTSPGISSVIQEVTDRAGWSSNNDIGLQVLDNTSSANAYRDFYDYNAGAASSAKFNATYTEAASTISVSGTCKQYDQTTNCADSETIKVAVDGSLQGQTTTTSSGAWTISGVTAPTSGQTITVFVDGVADSLEANAVTKYDNSGDITGVTLYERHLTIGSADNQTLSNGDSDNYDNSVSSDEDIFFEIDASNDLILPAASTQTETDQVLYILANNTYQPDSVTGQTITVPNLNIPTSATLTADANTFILNASGTPFSKVGTFTYNTSTFRYVGAGDTNIAAATYNNLETSPSSSKTGDYTATGAGQSSCNGDYTQSGTWMAQPAYTNGTCWIYNAGVAWFIGPSKASVPPDPPASAYYSASTITGTWSGVNGNTSPPTVVVFSGPYIYTLATGAINTNNFTNGDGTHTVSTTATANDPTFNIDGSFTNAASAIFVASNSATFSVASDYTNSGTFTHSSGSLTFDGTSTGHTINPGSSSFYNLTFNGSGGAWSPLTNTVNITNDLTMRNGTFDTATGTANVVVNGNVACNTTCGVINMTSTNTFTQNVAANKNFGTSVAGSTAWTFNNLTFSSSSGTPTITTSSTGTGDITVSSVLTISASTTWNAANRNVVFSGTTGTPFVKTGTFTASTSTVIYSGNYASGNTNVVSTTYYNLQLNNASETYIAAGDITASNVLTITAGTFTASNRTITLSGTGTPFVKTGSFTYSTSTIKYTGTGTDTTVTISPYYNLEFAPTGATNYNMAGGLTGGNSIYNNLTIGADATLNTTVTNYNIAITGNWTNNGTYTANSAQVDFNKATNSTQTINSGGTGTGKTFYNLVHSGAGTISLLTNGIKITNSFNQTDGIFNANGNDQYYSGAFSITDGSYMKGATCTFNGTGTSNLINNTNQDLGSVAISGASGKTISAQTNLKATSLNIAADNTLNITSKTLTLTGTGTPLVNSGTFTTTDSTIIYNGSGSATSITTLLYNNLTLFPSSATTYSLTGHLTGGNALAGSLTIYGNATLDTTASNYNLTLSGIITNSGTLTANASTIIATDYTQQTGTMTGGGSTLTFSGNVNLVSGTFTSTTGTLSVGGDWSDAGATFTHSSGTIDFTKAAGVQYLNTLGDKTYNNITHSGAGTLEFSQWGYEKLITIDNTMAPNTNQTNFPVLVSVTDAELKDVGNSGHVGQTDGDDIFFTLDSDNTKLSHEIEKYDSATGELIAWVKIPTLSYQNDTLININYGNTHALNQQNRYGVWSNGYAGVWHMPDGTTLSAADSSNYQNDGTNTSTSAGSGKIDGAGVFNGSSSRIAVHSVSPNLNSGDFTISGWVKFNTDYTTGSGGMFVFRSGDQPSCNDINFGFGNDGWFGTAGKFHIGVVNGTCSAMAGINSTQSSWTAGTWYHIAGTYSGTTITAYVNGSVGGTPGSSARSSSPVSIHSEIGDTYNESGPGRFNGSIDDLKVSNVARSADWVATEYNNQNNPTGYETFGDDGSLSVGTIAIAGNLTNSAGTLGLTNTNVSVAGNLNSTGGIISAGTSTVTLNGNAAQTLTADTESLYNLTVTNAHANGVTFADSATVTGTFTDVTASSKLTFDALSTYAFAAININGQASGTKITMVSNDPANGDLPSRQWYLNVSGASPSASYVNVTDSDANGGNLITATTGCINGGNNENWYFGITVSGTVYTAENKSTNIGADKTVALSINGAAATTAETTASGVFSFSSIAVAADNTVALFVSGETEKGSLITQAADGTTDITSLELYTGNVVLTHQTAGPMTNTLLATADNVSDSDLLVSVDVSSVATFTSTLWVISTKGYTPGAAVVTSGVNVDGALTLAANALTDTGSWDANTGSVTTSGTVSFTATSGTNSIGSGGQTFTNIIFNDAAGTATYLITSALDVNGTFTLSDGILDLDNNDPTVNIAGNITVNGGSVTKSSSNALVTLDGDLSYTNSAGSNLGDLYIGHSPDTTTLGSDLTCDTLTIDASDSLVTAGYNITDAGDLSIGSSATLNATTSGGRNSTISVGGNWSNSGTFTASTSTVTFTATDSGNTLSGNMTVATSSTFYKVVFNGTGGAWSINDPMVVTFPGTAGASSLDIAAGTVTVGNGTGDSLEVDGLTTIASTADQTATLQTYGSLTPGQVVYLDVNRNSDTTKCTTAYCYIRVGATSGTGQGNLIINKNSVLRLNPLTATYDAGVQVESKGKFQALGSIDQADTLSTEATDTTLTDAAAAWGTNDQANKYLRITTGLAVGLVYPIISNSSTVLTYTGTQSADFTTTVSGSGYTRTVCSNSTSIITANNQFRGRYVQDKTTSAYFLVKSSTNDSGSCSGNDLFTVIESPGSFSNLASGHTANISDGLQAGNHYEILQYAHITAEAGTACNATKGQAHEAYVWAKAGSESILNKASVCNLGRAAANYYGLSFYSVNGANSAEGITTDRSRELNGYYGIYLSGSSSNNTANSKGITNFTTSGNTNGIYLSSSSNNNTLSANTTNGNTYGIYLNSGSNNTLSTNTTSGNTRGIYLFANSNTLSANTTNGNTDGIYLNGNNNTLSSNTASANSSYGIKLASWTTSNTLSTNTTNGNSSGIFLDSNSYSNTLSTNTSSGNSEGIFLNWSSSNTLSANTTNGNTSNGIYLAAGSNNTVSNNTSNGNTSNGIYLYNGSSNTFSTNTTSSNNVSGIGVDWASDNNVFTGNQSYSNSYGVNLAGYVSTGNVFIGDNYGGSGANTTADIGISATNAYTLFLYNTTLASSTEVSGTMGAAAYIISRKHDGVAGATKIRGHYSTPADVAETPSPQVESTDKFNYANNLWEKSVTAHAWKGTNPTAGDSDLNYDLSGATLTSGPYAYRAVVNNIGTNGLCASAVKPTFDIFRNNTDTGLDATCGSLFTDTNGSIGTKFKIDGGSSAAYTVGDTYTFTTWDADNSASVNAKSITMMQDADTFTVPSGKTLELKGQSAGTNLTTITHGTGGYNFVVAGAIDAQYYSFDYMGNATSGIGLDLQSTATVTNLANGAYANFNNATAGNTYIKVNGDLIGTGEPSKTFANVSFAQVGANQPQYSITESGGSPSIPNHWLFDTEATCTGWADCEASDSDAGDGGGDTLGFIHFPLTNPDAPTIGTATAGNAQASVTFTPPGSDGGTPITGYTVTSTPGSFTGTGASSPIDVNGLANGTSYTFTVHATNAVGDGPESSASNAVIPSTTPDAPTIGTATAGSGVGQATITFSAPGSDGGSAITGYTVTSTPSSITGTGAGSPITVSGLANGTAYTFTVHSTNANGNSAESAASNSITTFAVPDAPTGGVTAVKGNAKATVYFSVPGSDGGTPITGYTVTSTPGSFAGTGAGSPIDVNGLTNGTSYTFTVHATNAVGDGPESSASNAVIPSTTPDAPTIGTATAGSGVGQATITFTPGSDGGSAITDYTVTSTPSSITGTGASSPITVSGLTNGTLYTFTVHATNAIGDSAESVASNSITTFAVPDAPTIGVATPGNAQASVTFTPPGSDGGTPITGYTVTSTPGSFTGTGAGSPITVNGLTNGTSYTFTVHATNIVGDGPESGASNAVIPATVPDAPTAVTATSGDTLAIITFTAPASNGGSAITGYTVTSTPGNITNIGGSSPIIVTGLTNGVSYTFTVHATNAIGDSIESGISNAATPAAAEQPISGVGTPSGTSTTSVKTTEIVETEAAPETSKQKEDITWDDFNFYAVLENGNIELKVSAESNIEVVKGTNILVEVPADIFAKKVNIITLSTPDSTYLMNLLSDKNKYQAVIPMPAVKGDFDLKILIVYEDGSIKEIKKNISVDPQGYVYTMTSNYFGLGKKQEVRIADAKVTLYQIVDGKPTVWDSAGKQPNPAMTNKSGEYAFWVEPGDYYLLAKKAGYKTVKTDNIKVDNALVIKNIPIDLKFKPWIWLILAGMVVIFTTFLLARRRKKDK